MSTLIRTDVVPASDRFDFVQELVATTWVPMECRSEHRSDYWGEIRASGLGAMQVAVLDILPITVCRTPELISQADPDLLKMLLVCGGSSVVDQDGQQAFLSAAELAFYDTRRPYEVACGVGRDRPTRVLTFMFPPSLLPLSPSGRKWLTAVRIPASAGLGDLTSQFLLQLARNVDHYSPAEAARLSTAALEVLATRLAHELDVHDWGTPETRRHALLTTVQSFIEQHLGDPQLSPAAIAAAHHISLRSLQQLFHDEGLTVAGWIRRRRLERCRRDLRDPALASRPVAAIAARWGFSSAGDFSRAFRAAHGLPPSEYRRSARVVKDPAR
ncbi:helix-turn-helix domain-containing protein [Actinomadura rudentiformis]|uniref:Helix-turn-helix domain-containing protein n=1 Tax=Actinomadura rudentiformis TaxID=359158 RepID=A0A6H9Z9Y9_9ACTN|nr:helix-turn-helix domain-containing protein [Actinomadura rudentiformis]KAB2352515.1 helix-turn-helix domain-containing protein [Actinomadura rudentiformis]